MEFIGCFFFLAHLDQSYHHFSSCQCHCQLSCLFLSFSFCNLFLCNLYEPNAIQTLALKIFFDGPVYLYDFSKISFPENTYVVNLLHGRNVLYVTLQIFFSSDIGSYATMTGKIYIFSLLNLNYMTFNWMVPY